LKNFNSLSEMDVGQSYSRPSTWEKWAIEATQAEFLIWEKEPRVGDSWSAREGASGAYRRITLTEKLKKPPPLRCKDKTPGKEDQQTIREVRMADYLGGEKKGGGSSTTHTEQES